MPSFSRIRENYLGVFLGALSAGVVLWVNPSYRDCIDLIRAIPQLTTCIFGFLLTLLGIILQGDGPLLTKMRATDKVYIRFIDYNKKVIILSFVLTLVALLAGYVDYDWLHRLFSSGLPPSPQLFRRIVFALLSFGAVWLVVDLMTFVILFYMIIEKSK